MKKSFLALLLASACNSIAAVVLTGDFRDGSSTPTVTFTEDLSFSITASGQSIANFIVFDEWVVSDGNRTVVDASPSTSLGITVDSTAEASNSIGLSDNFARSTGGITPNDGLFQFSTFFVDGGDQIVIPAGSYTFAANEDFNTALNDSTFTGNAFLTDSSGNQISNVITVPEPSVAFLAIFGSAAFLFRRRL